LQFVPGYPLKTRRLTGLIGERAQSTKCTIQHQETNWRPWHIHIHMTS
jgi:hypothetical protein